jgi:AcrR family transcriptional regulator
MMKRPNTRRFETRKSSIVSSAVDVLNRKGIRGMTLGDVAATLDLVPTAVIYYFKSKEELAAACFLKAIERYNDFISFAEAGTTVRERMRRFLQAYFEFRYEVISGDAEDIAVFNDVRALNAEPVNVAYVAMYRRARALLISPETEAWTRLELNARTHLLISEMFWIVAWIHRHDPEDYARIADRMASVTESGIAATGATGASGANWVPAALPPPEAEGADAANELFLKAATELINEEGYIGASVEKISARLNVSKGSFYHHNETKEELVMACFERTFEVMRSVIRSAEETRGSNYDILATAASALVEYQMSGKARLLRTSAITSAPESMQPYLLGQFDRISLRLASLISDGIADGSLRAVDANIVANTLTGMINAAAELHLWARNVTAKTVAGAYVRPFFEGLLSPPGR